MAASVAKFTKELYVEDVGPRRIQSIQFSNLSESDIYKLGEVQVHNAGYYDGRKSVPNGLLDPHMGPPNKSGSCATCYGEFANCPGHYGYLTLALPVYNVGYLATIVDILKCICKSCSRILLPENERLELLKKMRNPRMEPLKKTELFKRIVKRCTALTSSKKSVDCPRCGYQNGLVKRPTGKVGVVHLQPKYGSIEKECSAAMSHLKEFKGTVNLDPLIYPDRVLSLFKKMLDEDCELLYLSDRPEKFIMSNIAVPPTAIRPSVFVDGGERSNENDISERLKNIIFANNKLFQELSNPNYAQRLVGWDELQAEAALYINSDTRGVTKNMQSAKPLSGFVQRLKGKQGRFRGNLSGKRVEYTGRTVISPDPNLKITEVAVPILMASILTYPERVSRHNIEKLRQCVRNGAMKYPGAKFLKRPGVDDQWGLMFDNRKRLADELRYGDIVHRHLEDGDVVLFNRQPSLHRMSIMCHRARIMQWRTLRFNESVCNPYNADFDGDEMNMHVPQTEEARTEALMLMGVQNNLCTPKNGEILVASTQDFLTSSFLITRKDTFYDRSTFSLLCCYMGDAVDHIDLPTPALIKPIELWTGKQLLSVLLRPHADFRVYLNLFVQESNHKKFGGTMCPNDGYVCFRNSELVSGQLGKKTLGNGNKDGLYSVLLRDYNSHAAAACMNRLAKLSARWIGNHGFSIGISDVQPGGLLHSDISKTISKGFQKCDASFQEYNEGKLQVLSGCTAAQTLESNIFGILSDLREDAGKVCMTHLGWRNSPLIMSQCGSKGSLINISQMIACVGQQSVGGRRATDGFIDRNFPHFTRKSEAPEAKGFVANSFYSGLTATEFFFHTMAGREGLVDTAVKTADTGYMSRRLIKSLEDLSVQYDDTVRNASACIVQFTYGDDGRDPSNMEAKEGFPLHFERLLMKVKATCPAGQDVSITPSQIIKEVSARLARHDMTLGDGYANSFGGKLLDFLKEFAARLESTRRALNLDEENVGPSYLEDIAQGISGITARQLEVFLDTCISRYYLKKVDSGMAIGAIGAQSIGEPGTQMTLKTFHFAGVASMNVTQGVPRIKEIINAAKKISTPLITAKLENGNDEMAARVVKSRMERTVLGQVAKRIKLVLGPASASISVTLDVELIKASQLSINSVSVKESMLRNRNLKLKEQDIQTFNDSKLTVSVPSDKKNKVHFELHSLMNKLPAVVVKGIDTTDRVVIHVPEKEKKYELIAEGTGLLQVMGTEGVDGRDTTSNHIAEVQQTLGIEAARVTIIEEIQKTMKSHGMGIDIRHMKLLADVMTFKGEVLGITRYGLQKMKDSVLMLASFEKTADHLFNASVNGRLDKIEGVSECIIMGVPMQFGTGILKLRQRVPQVQLSSGLEPIMSYTKE